MLKSILGDPNVMTFQVPSFLRRKANPKNVVSIILGGGSGVQLFPLTKRAATPAVPVGGCYRLIDIPMSNCINSGINKVFVLTQFNSASLNHHISRTYFGNGINFGDGYVEVIADNVGDNVGDIAGMGSDLFGSYAEASCAALVVASISSFGINHEFTAMLFPLIISSVGLLVCLLTTLFATDFFEIKLVKEIEPALKKQLVISTILMTVGIAIVSWIALPSTFTIFNFGEQKVVKNWQLFLCVSVGLWAGLIIGFVTEYYTSNAYSPVQDVADSCRTGAATNVIFGLALGYKSVIIPIFSIAISIFGSFSFVAMYGVAVDALGMLSTIATGLAIDAYGPISDNAGGIAEMAGMSHRIRERTDALDAAGNTTAAIGKGFAIGSAALVSLALFGAFVSRAGVTTVDVLTPKVFIGLIVGAMLPYWFSAMTMKSVGSAALKMVEEVRRQFNTIPGLMEGTAKPDYATCVTISTDASIKEMIPPGALVMLTPLIVGIFFGVETLSGVLAGSLVSGVQIAISASNTGGAWDNAKKYIEAHLHIQKQLHEAMRAATEAAKAATETAQRMEREMNAWKEFMMKKFDTSTFVSHSHHYDDDLDDQSLDED
ncbi:Pyrophosphate-energized vacuolar membrane proton pump 1 [Lathyrus oleraceus]|uniref:H(+)-exporting diphosphatase n=2 Tax=Pisum sativum TaxID=3888 RepID=A0A9D5AA48_PEA|nr:Pyrophosphate-energized vacuolar membrane proton pump 1 [Pisum sativum]